MSKKRSRRGTPYPTSYLEANAMLQGRCYRQRRLPGRSTWLVRGRDNLGHDLPWIAVQYHQTNVVVFDITGTTIIQTGGYASVTTKDRINRSLPRGIGVCQRGARWYLSWRGLWAVKGETGPESCSLFSKVEWDGQVMEIVPADLARWKPNLRGIPKLWRDRLILYAQDLVMSLVYGALRIPLDRDCLFCLEGLPSRTNQGVAQCWMNDNPPSYDPLGMSADH